jgi:hypothetical protein
MTSDDFGKKNILGFIGTDGRLVVFVFENFENDGKKPLVYYHWKNRHLKW